MRLLSTLCFVLCTLLLSAQAEDKKLERALFDLPDVVFSKLSQPGQTPVQYLLRIKQPVDHQDVSKGYFQQRVVLTHRGFAQPTIMQTQGYEIGTRVVDGELRYSSRHELELPLEANHLNIEHRFFGESVPNSRPWKYLTLEQATADLHHINELFRKIYSGKWISSGISKGGQTTIFYKYFYPKDVDVWVPYVAPFNNSLEDQRIYAFLDTVGSAECRKQIFEFQKYMLQNEDKALEKLKWYAKGAGYEFDYLGGSLGKAFEYSVLEYSFSFWQWGSDCKEIPLGQSLDSCLAYLLKVSDLGFFSDRDMEKYAPHYYQAATQMGYYGYNIAPFRKYLKHFKTNPSAVFAPKEAGAVSYDNSLNEKVDIWLRMQGNNMIYIYGGYDTWSADRVTPSPQVNSKSYVLPGKDHGMARIKNMDKAMQEDLKRTLEEWLGVAPNLSALK